jgi:hypothetical protein
MLTILKLLLFVKVTNSGAAVVNEGISTSDLIISE